ncbi:MAG TPA: AtpZ/AtpI family protein [Dyella sp.]|uniref:AtpZ/AtpI family protein n=1 Tax=Dyella sp. TaxID=1869338 RepID=UPI002B7F3DE0|nr:AtpZ/AtpI family protein [Dyella sp.]HUB90355.1 AtpZ/AtpI family protein [Dyella sp.]
MITPTDRHWHRSILREVRRTLRAQRERQGLIGQSLYLGTLGLVFMLPVVACTYIGLWIDEKLPGYSVQGTLSGIVIGIAVGALNVYLMVRERR